MPTPPPSKKWRLLFSPPRTGAENMARDSALMERARRTGESVFSVYSWIRPALSLGRNQTARGRYDLEAIERYGADIVRRPTGGRALLHHHEVTYSVTAPIAEHESLADSYARINRVLMNGLARLGVHTVEARGGAPTPAPSDIPCFATPAEGELVADGGKLVGSAQYREDGALLQHGSILIEDEQALVASFLLTPDETLETPRAATLSQALGRSPSVEEVGDALFAAVRDREDPSATGLDECEIADSSKHLMEQYQSEWWTWRR
jgi:lipoyl(octanoyl) transferase